MLKRVNDADRKSITRLTKDKHVKRRMKLMRTYTERYLAYAS